MCGVIKHYKAYAPTLIDFTRKLLSSVMNKLAPMRETEIMYRILFEACGRVGLADPIKELYQELKSQKNAEMDKVTYSTYVESLVKCQEAEDSPFAQKPMQ